MYRSFFVFPDNAYQFFSFIRLHFYVFFMFWPHSTLPENYMATLAAWFGLYPFLASHPKVTTHLFLEWRGPGVKLKIGLYCSMRHQISGKRKPLSNYSATMK